MGTSIERHLPPEEVAQLQTKKESAERLRSGTLPTKFVFFAAFDGTNNDKDNLPRSKPPVLDTIYQTNVANLFDQAKVSEDDNFKARYYPGVGTGGERGNRWNAGPFPTEPLRVTADQAINEFAKRASDYLDTHPGATYHDLSVSMVSFSRGSATAMIFANKLQKEGLVLADGTQVAPPGAVSVTSNVMFDPVTRFVDDDLSLPANVRGRTLLIAARDEHRYDFRLADYASDPRVMKVELAGNHCGIGGGYDLHGTAAASLEIGTAYLKNSGIEIADVRPELRFDPSRKIPIYTEAYQVAMNGDVTGSPERPTTVWRMDTSRERQSAPVSPPVSAPVSPEVSAPASAPIVLRQAPPPRLDEPAHPGHALFKQAQSAMHQLDARHNHVSDHRSDQAAAAIAAQAHTEGLRRIHLVAPSADASKLYAYDGPGESVFTNAVIVPTMQALNTPVAQSTQAYDQATVQIQQQERDRALQQEQQQLQHQQTLGSPVMSR